MELLCLLFIFGQDLVNKCILITFNFLLWLEQSLLDSFVVIEMDITHALSIEYLLCLEKHVAPEGVKACHELSFETERYHFILELNDLLKNELPLTLIEVLFVDGLLLHLGRSDRVVALQALLIGKLCVIDSLVPILDNIRLVFKVVVAAAV